MKRPCFFIMASGSGSNAEHLAKTAIKNQLALKGLICDQKGAFVLRRMERLGIPSWVLLFPNEEQILHLIEEKVSEGEKVWIFLAGYRRLLSSEFLKYFYDPLKGVNRVVNIHPSLLPLFKGLGAYEKAFSAGVKESGCTVHFVDEGMDTGRIIVQEKFNWDTQGSGERDLEAFKRRGLELEHKIYPEVLKKLLLSS